MEKALLKYFNLIRIIIAIAIGILISVVIILLVSANPGESLRLLLLGPFLNRSRFGNIIEMACPIIFCGLAIAVPFQAEQFNVGAEGALFIGAAVGTAVAVSTRMPVFIHIPFILLIAGLTGALWGFIPGYLKAKWQASELVSTLMLNYVAFYIGLFIINHYFRDKNAGYLVSYYLPETAWLPQIIPGTRIHLGVIFSVLFAGITYFFLYHTTTGYEIRITGMNPHFARYGGINVGRVIVMSQMVGGFLAAMGGMIEVMGIYHRFNWQSTPGYGWDGVMVAIIGRNHPIFIIFASLFLAYLRVGGQVLNLLSDVPSEVISVIQSIIILLITAEAFLERYRQQIIVREVEMGGEKIS